MSSSDNKRVAKNALALTLRMILITIVGLYTSRIVLEALGVVDYGIYGVVGGVVGMASFLNSSMTGATSRFITFEMGRGNQQKLKDIFSTALLIHFGLSIIVVLLAETIGLWFINHKMVFPPERMGAVNILYQLSILSMIISFTQVPYAADIIAHEKMNIYAYFEIINVVLKLAIVYLLLIIPYDRLVFYASMVFCISILNAMFYRWYCIRNFPEARFSKKFDRSRAKEMISFSAYDLYGNMCAVAKNQGEPIVLNLFFGVVANAASSLALTVTGAVDGLTTTITSAFSPQIVKQYACDNFTAMSILIRRAVQFTLLAYAMVAIPCIIEAKTILYLWLGQTPPYSEIFLQLVLVAAIPQIISRTNNVAIRATGHIRLLSIVNGTFYLSIPVISYILFKSGLNNASTIYVVGIVMLTLCTSAGFWITKKEVQGIEFATYSIATVKSLFPIGVALLLGWIIHNYVVQGNITEGNYISTLCALAGRCVIYDIIILMLTLAVAFNRSERQALFRMIKNRRIN